LTGEYDARNAYPEMKTNPWQKHTPKDAMLLMSENILVGIIGYRANFISLRTNKPATMTPKTIRQMTVAESQGNDTPPNCRPNRTMSVPPTMVRLPVQSTAFRPSQTGVFGLSRCKKKKSRIVTVPVIGTTKVSIYICSANLITYD